MITCVEQVPEGMSPMVAPQMMPCYFVPQFCDGMSPVWMTPMAGPMDTPNMELPPMWMPPPAMPTTPGPYPMQQNRRNRMCRKEVWHTPESTPKHQFAGSPGGHGFFPQQDRRSEEPVAVELSSLPKMLCNKACLEAAIEQAGLESDVQSLEVQDSKAMLLLASEQAAQRCIRHFHGLQWAKSSEPVSARYSPQVGKEQPQQRAPESPVTTKAVKTGVVKAAATPVKLPVTPKAKVITASPKSSSQGSPSNKPRWADIDTDSEDDDDHTQSTRSGSFIRISDGESSNTD